MSIKERFRISKSVSEGIPLSQVDGGVFPLAALLPFAAAAGIPLASSAGKWIGKKIFGQGIRQSGMVGNGILRSGDMLAPQNRPMHINPLMGATKGISTYAGNTVSSGITGSGRKRSTKKKAK